VGKVLNARANRATFAIDAAAFEKALASSGRMKSGRPGLSLMANFSKLAADPASSLFSQANLHKN